MRVIKIKRIPRYSTVFIMRKDDKNLSSLILRCKEGLLVHIIFSAISEAFEEYDLTHRTGISLEAISKHIAMRYPLIEKNITETDASLLSPYFKEHLGKGSKANLLHFYELLDSKTKLELETIVIQEARLNIIRLKRNISKRLDDLYSWIRHKS